MKPHRSRWLGLFIGLAALFAVAAFPAMASADVPPEQVPNDLAAAIKAKVESEGHQYAGLCHAIDQSGNAGKYCATVLSLSATEAEVTYGPVSSEPTAHIVFSLVNGVWTHAGGGPGEGEPSAVPADLKAAIKAFVESKGHQYAGLCAEIDQGGSTNTGKYCASVSNLTATSASVHYGRVASDEITTVAFEKKNGTWAPKATNVSTPATPKPPKTGTGTVGGEGGSGSYVPAAIVGVLLATSLGFLAARRR